MATESIADVCNDVWQETCRAMELHAPQRTAHESYAVILEELEEFWGEVKKKRAERDERKMREELIQAAAMCVRAIVDLGLKRRFDNDER